MGTLYQLMTTDEDKAIANEIGLGKDSTVMLFSTEGDTNPTCYRNIVWDGSLPL